MDAQATGLIEHSVNNYYRELLNEREQTIYDNVERAYRSFQYVVDVPDGTTLEEARRAINAVLFDHPDIFWATAEYEYKLELWGLSNLTLFYIYDNPDQIMEMKARYDDIAQDVIQQAYEQADVGQPIETELARYFYKWLIDNTLYEGSDKSDQHISSVFDDKKSVCAGFSKAMKFLCDKVGIPCLYVRGGAFDINQGEIYSSHAWNVLEINKRTCYVDSTWGDGYTSDNDEDVSWYWFDVDYLHFRESHLSSDGEFLDRPLWEDGIREEDPDPILNHIRRNLIYYEHRQKIDDYINEHDLSDNPANRLMAVFFLGLEAPHDILKDIAVEDDSEQSSEEIKEATP